jgi:hypothetical protein
MDLVMIRQRIRVRWIVVFLGLALIVGYALLLYRMNVMPFPDGALARQMLRAVRSTDSIELRRFISDNGPNADARFHYAAVMDTRSALQLAAELCRCTSIKVLLEAGEEPRERSHLKQNALDLAVRSDCSCGVELLVRAGLDPLEGAERGRAPAQAAFDARKVRSLRAMAKATEDPATRARIEELIARLP